MWNEEWAEEKNAQEQNSPHSCTLAPRSSKICCAICLFLCEQNEIVQWARRKTRTWCRRRNRRVQMQPRINLHLLKQDLYRCTLVHLLSEIAWNFLKNSRIYSKARAFPFRSESVKWSGEMKSQRLYWLCYGLSLTSLPAKSVLCMILVKGFWFSLRGERLCTHSHCICYSRAILVRRSLKCWYVRRSCLSYSLEKDCKQTLKFSQLQGEMLVDLQILGSGLDPYRVEEN